MATSHPVETPVESDADIDEAVKQILAEIEVEEHIITRVIPSTDPLQDFEENDPSQFIVIDDDTDGSSDADDLSEVSMVSAGGIGKQEFQALLSDVAAQHQRMAASLDALASRVEDMSVGQVEEAAVRVVSESGHV